jgi:hypothetical protein
MGMTIQHGRSTINKRREKFHHTII